MSIAEITFEYLDKRNFVSVSTSLFSILADNMEKIAPTGNMRDEDYKFWYEGVYDGLKRHERQIILVKDTDSIIGFFQYYIKTDTLMMEEIQLKSEYQGKNIFRSLYGFLLSNISNDLNSVEAYASITNHKSIGILERLGLSKIGTNRNGRSFHFKGSYSDLEGWFNNTDENHK